MMSKTSSMVTTSQYRLSQSLIMYLVTYWNKWYSYIFRRTKTYMWDIQDLENPILIHTHISEETSIDHNQYIIDDIVKIYQNLPNKEIHETKVCVVMFQVYQTNYEAGLRVLRINSQTPSLTELAYFDVFPSRTTADCCFGAWSNYPWLRNGQSFKI